MSSSSARSSPTSDGHGHGQHGAATAQLEPSPMDRGHFDGPFHPVGEAQAAGVGVERRELVGLPAQHRHRQHLEVLQRARQVEKGLGTAAHGDHRMAGDGAQVGADVAALGHVAVHAADPAGGEDADARLVRPAPATPRRWWRRTRPGGRAPPPGHVRRLWWLRRGGGRDRPEETPTVATPSTTAVIAAVTPRSAQAAWLRSSASAPASDGRPSVLYTVLSMATTGRC